MVMKLFFITFHPYLQATMFFLFTNEDLEGNNNVKISDLIRVKIRYMYVCMLHPKEA